MDKPHAEVGGVTRSGPRTGPPDTSQAGEQRRGTALGPYGYPQGNYVQIGRPSERDPAA